MTTERTDLNGGEYRFRGSDTEATATSLTIDLAGVLDNVEVPVVVVRQDLIVSYFNRSAASLLSASPTDIGRPCRDIPALAALPRLEERCNRVITDGVDARVDFHRDNRWFVIRISPYGMDNHQHAGAILTFTNVTAFRASIDQAIYERECSKAILNTVTAPLIVLDTEQRIQSANRAFYSMFGVSRDHTQGLSIYELANGVFELAALRKQLKEMSTGSDVFQQIEVERVVLKASPRTVVIDAHPLALPGHSERRALLTFQDITARKQAEAANDQRVITERKRSEEELRRSEAFLADAQRLSLTGSFLWRVETGEITWSEQLYRIFDLSPPLTPLQIRSRIHPDDIATFEGLFDQARDSGNDFEWQYRLLMPDQSIKYLHAAAHAIRNQDGQLEYIATVQDVTERRLSDEALDTARSELARVTRAMSLGALTASIAHEVNQPLSGIITNTSTCLRMLNTSPPDVDGARETVRRTLRDGNRASEVIKRLRALFSSKNTAPESVDVNEAAREVVTLLTGELQRKRILLRMELVDELPIIMGDRVQIQQVILNLVRNASDAMSMINDRSRELIVRSEHHGDLVCLIVKDAGIGFTSEAADRLFDAFYTTKHDGMGIGLSVSRSIIENHHGQLRAKLNDGPGATFAFSLPCAAEGSRPHEQIIRTM